MVHTVNMYTIRFIFKTMVVFYVSILYYKLLVMTITNNYRILCTNS